MKKLTVYLLSAACMIFLIGCGGRSSGQEQSDAAYTGPLELLEVVADSYGEEELFAMYGGDQEHAVMDAPGAFDITKTQELENTLGLPAELAADIEEAASMVHLMNGNTFTGAAYRLKTHTDRNAFARELKAALSDRQWLCGQPDTMAVLAVGDSYVITAYGEAGMMDTFQKKALSALDGASVLTQAPIV